MNTCCRIKCVKKFPPNMNKEFVCGKIDGEDLIHYRFEIFHKVDIIWWCLACFQINSVSNQTNAKKSTRFIYTVFTLHKK